MTSRDDDDKPTYWPPPTWMIVLAIVLFVGVGYYLLVPRNPRPGKYDMYDVSFRISPDGARRRARSRGSAGT